MRKKRSWIARKARWVIIDIKLEVYQVMFVLGLVIVCLIIESASRGGFDRGSADVH